MKCNTWESRKAIMAVGEYLEDGEFSELYWKHDGHWNMEGNHFVGMIISKYIMEKSLISTENKAEKLQKINEELEDFNL